MQELRRAQALPGRLPAPHSAAHLPRVKAGCFGSEKVRGVACAQSHLSPLLQCPFCQKVHTALNCGVSGWPPLAFGGKGRSSSRRASRGPPRAGSTAATSQPRYLRRKVTGLRSSCVRERWMGGQGTHLLGRRAYFS